MQIHTIPEKMTSTWAADVKAVVDTWQNYNSSLEEFKAALDKGINHAKANGGVAWIVDSSQAKGTFTQEIQAFIESDVFPAFAKNGIKYFITINSEVSAITKMSVSSYSAKAGPLGVKLLELNSADDAKEWLKANA